MSGSSLQNALKLVYSEWQRSLRSSQEDLSGLSPPLLMSVQDSYANAERRVLFFGQETFGWGWTKNLKKEYPKYSTDYPYHDIQNIKDFASNEDAVEALCWGYREFDFAAPQPKTWNSPFWQAFREVHGELEGEILWNNVSRCDYNGGTVLSAPIEIRDMLLETQTGLVNEELDILKPNICLFMSGPNYDEMLSRVFPGIAYESIGSSPIREIARLIHPRLPKSSIRTYHPRYLRQNKQWHLLKQMIDIVKSEN